MKQRENNSQFRCALQMFRVGQQLLNSFQAEACVFPFVLLESALLDAKEI